MLYCVKKGAVNIVVQILLATYNGEKYISALLESLLAQTYQNFKIIANDDCSKDNTFNILKDYENKFPDKIEASQNPVPSGCAKNNFFNLLKLSHADYVMFCDQDDIWEKDKVEKTLKVMLDTESRKKDIPVLVHTDLKVVDENLNILNNSYFRFSHIKNSTELNRAVVQNCVTGCTAMINKSLLDLIIENNENIIMHDWWVYLIASTFGKIAFLNESTVLYRQHKNNSVGAKGKYLLSKKEMQLSINKTIKQCLYFFNIYKDKLSSSQAEMLSLYSDIKKENSLKRLFILCKYKILKRPLIKGLFQIITTIITD